MVVLGWPQICSPTKVAIERTATEQIRMNEEELFELALQTPPDEVAALLDRECVELPDLRKRIERLLKVHNVSNLLDRPIDANNLKQAVADFEKKADNSKTLDYVRHDNMGQIIGQYTLERLLGEGGMGAVWIAKQTEPVKRRVALKLIKTGMDSREVLSRFEHERQALAVMDHPNIARVIDAGMTGDGRPYFAMELVNGLPLTKFCDEAKLTTEERLDVFVQVCSAVQHAHQKGIIHRDLKPANILVTLIDGKAVPKVIDFGVSKALSGGYSEHSLTTQFGAIIGTIEYMAPEQAGYSGTDIDTRADIYALGVILYELLTGLKPFDSQRIRKAALDEVIRIIREEEPSKPSTRLSSSESRPSLAAARGLDPSRLARLLRGDLDWIALKCLEKNRNRRYETANQLALEIKRYLADEPVTAGPPTAGYLMKKFLRRNRRGVLGIAAVFAALLVGLGGSLWQMQRAMVAERQATELKDEETKQRQLADEQRELAENNAQRATEGNRQAREALDTVTDDVVRSLFAKTTKLTDSERQFCNRLLAMHDHLAEFDGNDFDSLNRRMTGYWRVTGIQGRLGAYDDAQKALERMANAFEEMARRIPENYRVRVNQTAALRGALAVAWSARHLDDAEQLLTKAEAALKAAAVGHADDPYVREQQILLEHDRAGFLLKPGSPTREATFARLARESEELLDTVPENTGVASLVLSCLREQLSELSQQGRHAEALANGAHQLELLESDRPAFAKLPQEFVLSQKASAQRDCGGALAAMERLDESIAAYNRGLGFARQRRDSGFARLNGYDIVWDQLRTLQTYLAAVYARQGKWKEAAASFREALAANDRWSEFVNDQKPLIQGKAWAQSELAQALEKGGGSPEETLAATLACAEFRESHFDKFDNPRDVRDSAAVYREQAADILMALKRPSEAADERRNAMAIHKTVMGDYPEAPFSLHSRIYLGWDHLALGRIEFASNNLPTAVAEYDRGIAMFREILEHAAEDAESRGIKDRARDQIGHAHHQLADQLMHKGQLDDARKRFDQAIAVRQPIFAERPDSYAIGETLAWSWRNRGGCELQLGNLDVGASNIKSAIAALGQVSRDNPNRAKFIDDCAHVLDIEAENQRSANRPVVALPIFREVLAIREALAADIPDSAAFQQHIVWTHHNICLALADLGKSDEAVQELEGLEQPLENILSNATRGRDVVINVGDTVIKMAFKLRNFGKARASLGAFETALRVRQRAAEWLPDDPALRESIAWTHQHLGGTRLVLQENDEAIASFQRAIDEFVSRIASTPSNNRIALEEYNRLVLTICKALDIVNLPRAVADFSDAYQDRDPTENGGDVPKEPTILSRGAIAHLTLGEFPQAERDFRRCLMIRDKVAPNSWQAWNTRSFLGDALISQGKLEEAEPYLLAGYEGMLARQSAIGEEFNDRLHDAVSRLIRLAEAQNKPDEVKRWAAELARFEVESQPAKGQPTR